MISVVIPVGPYESNQRWLCEAIDSVRAQADEILLVDDMAHIDIGGVTIVKNDWLLGVAASFNIGVARAKNECVFLMGSDDTLVEDCLEQCMQAYKGDAYYWVGVHYMGNEWEDQFLPCNAAMVTKGLWRATGGFPVEASTGMCDSILHDILQANGFPIICVNHDRPLYNYRSHENSDTNRRRSWHPIASATRNLCVQQWVKPSWT